MRSKVKNRNLIVIILALTWCVIAWQLTNSYYINRTGQLVEQELELTELRSEDLANSFQQNLTYMQGIPVFFSTTSRVNKALDLFAHATTPSRLPFETKRDNWTNNPILQDLSSFLAQGNVSLGTNLIYVVNAAGDCIAASNWGTAESPIGTNFAERDFFKKNKSGELGQQYAIGKTTHIAGLYFSAPIYKNKRFMGAVVVKIDVPSLYFIVQHTNAYLADSNGVIILAHDKQMVMHTIPDASVSKLPIEKVKAIYQHSEFPPIEFSSWRDPNFSNLKRLEGSSVPFVQSSKKLPDFGLTVYVSSDIATFSDIDWERKLFAILIALLGCGLMVGVAAAIFYVQSIKRTKLVLEENERRLNESQHTAHLGSWELDLVENKLVWSDEVFLIFEIDKSKFDASYAAFLQAIHPMDRERVSRAYSDHLLNREPYEVHHRLLMADGRIKYVEEKCNSQFDIHGKALISIGTVQDVTHSKLKDESMQVASMIYKFSTEAVMITDEKNIIQDVNPAFVNLTGYTLEEVVGKNPNILKSGRHDKDFYKEMWHSLETTNRWQGEIWDKRKDGSIYIKYASLNVIRNLDGGIYRYVAQFFDISERKRQEEVIRTQANYDSLTGLPNRRLFMDRLDQEIKKAHRAGHVLALIFLDLDRFKEVNDTLGHAKGDLLLKQAALRLSECVRETDTVARLGGDEFTLILPEFGERLHLERIAQNIINVLAQPFDLSDGDNVYISGSLGITLYPEDALDREGLLKHADQAMYSSKAQGRNRFSYFTESMQQEAIEKRVLTNELRSALSNRELEVYFQPIVDMKTGAINKAEALLRWKHPVRGMVSPMIFIPLAEESGLIVAIGDWVFQESMACIERWELKLGRTIQVSVNMSPIQFDQSSSSTWMECLADTQVISHKIAVEITEGLLIKDSMKVKQKLLEFRNFGIEVSIDDFGTGFSALSYLKQFDIDYLKIDRSFVQNLIEDESDKALTEAIIVMAHKLGIKTIAEGVETEAQRDALSAFGCDYVQGYLYSRPVPAVEFEALLGSASSSFK